MSETKTTRSEKSEERPVMHKRVEKKDDGRTLIYYTFGDASSQSQQSNGAEKK